MTDVAAGTSGVLLSRIGEQVVEVKGSDRLSYLEATTSQTFIDAQPGTATAALVLDANGGPLAVFVVLVLADRVWLVTPSADVTATVVNVLGGRTFLSDVRFAVRDDCIVVRVHAAAGRPDGFGDTGSTAQPSVAEFARQAWTGVSVVPRTGTVRATPSGRVAVADDTVLPSLIVAGESQEVDELAGRLLDAGAAVGGAMALEELRIASGGAAWGKEIAPPHLPEELGLLATHVHLAKGCYPGQEAVARMWMLGRPRRRLARVALHGADIAPLVPGWQDGEGRSAVEVTAVDGRSGLAFVPGSADVGDRFGDDVSVEVLEFPGGGTLPPGHDPGMRRRRDRDRSEATPPRRAPGRPQRD